MKKYFEILPIKLINLKEIIRFSIVILSYILVLLFINIQISFSNWVSFRGNQQLTGVSESQLPEKLDLLWTFKVEDMIESTVTIYDGTVYVAALDGKLHALNAETGKSKWKYDAKAPIKSSPSISDGVIYFGDENGIFHAVDIKTQKKKWLYTTEGEIVSSANFIDNRVLFGSYDGFLYCLNMNSGDLIWKFETEGNVHATPSVWLHKSGDTSTIGNYVIVTGCDSYLRIIDIQDGTQAEMVNLGTYVGASPAILDNQVFCGTYGSEILSVSLDNGEITWRYQHPKLKYPFIGSAAVTGDEVIIGGHDKMIHALSHKTGDPIWTYRTKSRIESSPIVVGERVFFGTIRGLFIALDLTSGELVWEYDTGDPIVASPSVSDGRIYIGNEGGILFCFGKK
ncbi:PQQ-like beta-propeller repeat protein [Candidatus Poribacteria bacterium]|nr:PQQ-like beta-propeller repeat protein [Candidatus Poribacteria bacterium]